jgi:hypothetical protein
VKIIQVTLWLYRSAFARSWEAVRKNWVVSFAPILYGVALSLIGALVAPLGIVAGIILALATQACISSGLYLVENIVRGGSTGFDDFVNGFTVYFWELVQIAFILWIPMRVLALVLEGVPNGALIYLLVEIALYVLLNPVPEFIYQSRLSGLELLSASYNFIVENWIEWFVPNIIVGLVGYFLLTALETATFALPGFIQFFVVAFGVGLFLAYFMVFRGFLFSELHGTTRRSRLFRYNSRYAA